MRFVWKNWRSNPFFYTREGEVKFVFFTNKTMILLVYKKACFNTNQIDHCVPSVVVPLLQEFNDVFPDDIPSGLPPLRGVEHQIDFIPEFQFLIDQFIEAISRRW